MIALDHSTAMLHLARLRMDGRGGRLRLVEADGAALRRSLLVEAAVLEPDGQVDAVRALRSAWWLAIWSWTTAGAARRQWRRLLDDAVDLTIEHFADGYVTVVGGTVQAARTTAPTTAR